MKSDGTAAGASLSQPASSEVDKIVVYHVSLRMRQLASGACGCLHAPRFALLLLTCHDLINQGQGRLSWIYFFAVKQILVIKQVQTTPSLYSLYVGV